MAGKPSGPGTSPMPSPTVEEVPAQASDTAKTARNTAKSKAWWATIKAQLKIIWPFLRLILGLAWIGPIIALLVLNFEGYVAGASVGCGVGNCDVSYLSRDNITQELDTKDHNILGTLQLVAKTLEVWFIFMAGDLVYNLSMLLAKKADGLPLRYLMTHKEFGELSGLLYPSFWATAFKSAVGTKNEDASTQVQKGKWKLFSRKWKSISSRKWKLFGFILFVAALAIVSNLMGPATAVLLIPTLGWQEYDIPQTQAFATIASSGPPINPAIDNPVYEGSCNASLLSSGNYSCTYFRMSAAVDGMMRNIELLENSEAISGLFQSSSGTAAYSFNISINSSSPVLAPNRQTVAALGLDMFDWIISAGSSNFSEAVEVISEVTPVENGTLPDLTQSQYDIMRNALQLQRQRQGPALSSVVQCYFNISVVQISADKSVHCYDLPNPDRQLYPEVEDPGRFYPYPISGFNPQPVSTMCIRVGSSWGNASVQSNFNVELPDFLPGQLAVNIYSSDRAIYLDSNTYSCQFAGNKTTGDLCNWDAMFSMDLVPDYISTSVNPQITEYSYPFIDELIDIPPIWCRSFAYLKFPTYVISNVAQTFTNVDLNAVVEDNTITNPSEEAVSVHPDWLLAAWSVDINGTVPYTRSAAQVLIDIFLQITTGLVGLDPVREFVTPHQVMVLNALSLIDYSMQDSNVSTPTNPIFTVSILTYVWAYGIESRTSRMGVAIALCGCIVAVLYFIIGLLTRTVDRSLINFVLVALEQEPPKVFPKLKENEFRKRRIQIGNEEEWKYKVVA
jgi:hypothetical protein